MKTKILIVPLIAVILIFTAVGLGHAKSPYVPNIFSYDPEWKGDLPKIGGYVDVYWTYSQNYDPQYNALEAEKVDFTVDRFEGFIQHRVTDWADGYIEMSVDTWLKDQTDISLDEAWLRVKIPIGSGLTLLGGVYDVPIGIDPNENIDIWNWQFKMVNIMVEPWAFTGGMAEYEIGPVNINFWIANDWGHSEVYGFARTGRVDPDTEKVFGGRIGFCPDEMFDLGVSVVWGNEKLPADLGVPGSTGNWQSRTLVDLDFKWLDLPDFLGALNFQLWWLELTDTPAIGEAAGLLENAQAFGGVAQFNFKTPWDVLSVSLGYEYLQEEDGIVFGDYGLSSQTRQSVEVTPIWAIGDHVITDVTWRSDWSTDDVFVNADGEARDFTWLTAWEWYYYF